MPPSHRCAPPGFTPQLWRTFEADGIAIVENALTESEVETYLAALGRLQRRADAGGFFTMQNFIEQDPSFAALIDHPAHVGLVYDLFGEMLKLQLSELFVRPPGDARPERWHIDGPRVVPYAAFTDRPVQVKVGYWLSDIPKPNMGNLVYAPGSHRAQHFDSYDTDETVPGERQLCVRRGTMTLMNTALWHRTAANDGTTARLNLYLGYSPSWIPTSDRITSNAAWLATLNREQRIIMRSYDTPFAHAKPPHEDFPLFLDRETGADREFGKYRDHVRLFHRKRTTWAERELMRTSSKT